MTRQLTVSGFFIALGLILPMLFHLAGGMGVVFLPMHLPVLLAGFFLGPRFGLLVGIITPLLSSLLTGMPPLLPFPGHTSADGPPDLLHELRVLRPALLQIAGKHPEQCQQGDDPGHGAEDAVCQRHLLRENRQVL